MINKKYFIRVTDKHFIHKQLFTKIKIFQHVNVTKLNFIAPYLQTYKWLYCAFED